jgi:hypothetical protein
MKSTTPTAVAFFVPLAAVSANEFYPPVALGTKDGPARSDSPGYASPCLADVDGDGKDELLVGQFAGGNIAIYEIGDLKAKEAQLAKKRWLMINGKRAEVPGVW